MTITYRLVKGSRLTNAEVDANFSTLVASDDALGLRVTALEDGQFNLPVATDTVLGGVKIGAGVSVTADGVISVTPASVGAIPMTQRGTANGVATLDAAGLVPAAQLPSYVDDVLEFANFAAFPATGETGKIYIALDTNFQYRWSGTVYIQLTASPGTTDAVPEGTTNLYFTTARVLATVLTGLSLVTGGAIVSTDTVLAAFGKVQKQINDLNTAVGNKLTNVMTSVGDLIIGGTAGAPQRLGVGTTGQVLTVVGSVPAWAAPSSGSSAFLTPAPTAAATAAGQTAFGLTHTAGAGFLVFNGNVLRPDAYTEDGTGFVLIDGTNVKVGTRLYWFGFGTFSVGDALPLAGVAADSSKLNGQAASFYAAAAALTALTALSRKAVVVCSIAAGVLTVQRNLGGIVTAVSRVGTGVYAVTIVAQPDIYYPITGLTSQGVAASQPSELRVTTKTTTGFRVELFTSTGVAQDAEQLVFEVG